MNRKVVGNSVSFFGIGLAVSSNVYTFGYMESKTIAYIMLVSGTILFLIGTLLKHSGSGEKNLINRKVVGNSMNFLGFGVMISSIVHPLGYMESAAVFYIMLVTGMALSLIGSLMQGRKGEKSNH